MTKIDLKTAGPFIALVALFIIGIFVNDAFLSAGNVSNILARSSFIGIVAIGATFVITTGGIDLSVGSMAAFISGCMILLMNALMSAFDSLITIIFLAIIASAAIGALAGMINGLLTTKAKIEAFIVTLGTMGIYRSLVTYMADGGTLSLNFTIGDVYSEVYYGTLLGLPYPVWVFLAVAIIGYVLLNMTVFGRHCFAVGSNESVAHYSAINVDRVKTATYILQGSLRVDCHDHLCATTRLGVRSDWYSLGAGSDRCGDHRRHHAQGWLRAHLGHGCRRVDTHADWQHTQSHRCGEQLSQWRGARGDRYRCCVPAARRMARKELIS